MSGLSPDVVERNLISPEPLADSMMQVKRIPSISYGSPPNGVENEDGRICMSFLRSDPEAV